MVLDSEGESILISEKSRLKADGVQEGPNSGHVGNELPLAEEERGATISILEPMEQLRGELSQPGADEAPGKIVETVLIVQREEKNVVLGVED